MEALESCRTPVRELDEAFLEAWQEFGERLAARSVSVNATAVGQVITGKLPRRSGSKTEHSKVADGLP